VIEPSTILGLGLAFLGHGIIAARVPVLAEQFPHPHSVNRSRRIFAIVSTVSIPRVSGADAPARTYHLEGGQFSTRITPHRRAVFHAD
jgi:hypothetical protein